MSSVSLVLQELEQEVIEQPNSKTLSLHLSIHHASITHSKMLFSGMQSL